MDLFRCTRFLEKVLSQAQCHVGSNNPLQVVLVQCTLELVPAHNVQSKLDQVHIQNPNRSRLRTFRKDFLLYNRQQEHLPTAGGCMQAFRSSNLFPTWLRRRIQGFARPLRALGRRDQAHTGNLHRSRLHKSRTDCFRCNRHQGHLRWGMGLEQGWDHLHIHIHR